MIEATHEPRDELGSAATPAASRRVFDLALLAVLAAVVVGLRFFDLEADPSPALSGEYMTDEGWWAHNARNHYLTGNWIRDDFNQSLYATPLHTILLRGAFEVLGIGLWQARAVSAASGCLAIALLFVALRHSLGRTAALLGAFAFSADYFTFTYQRVALVEANMTAVLVLSLTLCAWPTRRPAALFLAGLFAVMAVFTKMNAVFALPALAVGALLSTPAGPAGPWQRSARFQSLLWFCAGAGVCGLLWIGILIGPHWEEFISQNRRLAVEAAYEGWIRLTAGFGIGVEGDYPLTSVRTGRFLRQAFLPVGLGLAWATAVAMRIRRIGLREARERMGWMEWVALVWIAGVALYLFTHQNAVDRRYACLVPPLCILGAALLSPAWREVGDGDPDRASIRRRVGAAAVLLVVVAAYLRVPIMRALVPLSTGVQVGDEPGFSLGTLAVFSLVPIVLVGLPLAVFALDRSTRFAWRPGVLATLALVVSVPALIPLYAAEFRERSHTMRDVSAALAKRVGPDGRVFGGVADTLLLGSPNRTLFLLDRTWAEGRVYGSSYLAEFDPTHVLVEQAGSEAEVVARLAEDFPNWHPVPGQTVIYALCPGEDGSPRYTVGVATLQPQLAALP